MSRRKHDREEDTSSEPDKLKEKDYARELKKLHVEINTRVWLTSLSRTLGRPATLDDVPDAELDQLAARGFDWIWLLSVWQTGSTCKE